MKTTEYITRVEFLIEEWDIKEEEDPSGFRTEEYSLSFFPKNEDKDLFKQVQTVRNLLYAWSQTRCLKQKAEILEQTIFNLQRELEEVQSLQASKELNAT